MENKRRHSKKAEDYQPKGAHTSPKATGAPASGHAGDIQGKSKNYKKQKHMSE